MTNEVGKWLMAGGMLLIVLGAAIYFFHDKLNWIGRLPGDIRIERENFRFYFPFTTMVIVSIVLSLLIRLLGKWLR